MTAHILSFSRRSAQPVSLRPNARPASGTADIIIFPGVRYETASASNGPADRTPRGPTRRKG